MATVDADRLARLGLAAIRAIGTGGSPTRDELAALAEADATIAPGRLDELTRTATMALGRIDRAGIEVRASLDALQPGDAPVDAGDAAHRVGVASRQLERALSGACDLHQILERYAEAVEAGAAVASYPGDAQVQRCPGKGERTGVCGGILRRGWKLCAACHHLRSSSRPTRS